MDSSGREEVASSNLSHVKVRFGKLHTQTGLCPRRAVGDGRKVLSSGAK